MHTARAVPLTVVKALMKKAAHFSGAIHGSMGDVYMC